MLEAWVMKVLHRSMILIISRGKGFVFDVLFPHIAHDMAYHVTPYKGQIRVECYPQACRSTFIFNIKNLRTMKTSLTNWKTTKYNFTHFSNQYSMTGKEMIAGYMF